jgi:predicted transglutaminase-like cysteine proteinase
MKRARLLRFVMVCLMLVSTFVAHPAAAKSASEKIPILVALLGSKTAASARLGILKHISKSSHRIANLEYHIDPLMNPVIQHEVMADTQFSADFWATIRPVDQKVEVYVAPTSDMDFLMRECGRHWM